MADLERRGPEVAHVDDLLDQLREGEEEEGKGRGDQREIRD